MKIITTVGTSVFTNILREEYVHEKKEDVRDDYKLLENQPATKWESRYEDIEHLKKNVIAAWKDSAEIKSILAIAGELKEDVEVYLLATDTVLSVLACLLIMEWFEKNHNKSPFSVTFKVVDQNGNDVCLTANNRETLTSELVVKDLRVMSDSSSSSSADNLDDATINSGFLNLIDKIRAITSSKKDSKKDDFLLNITGGYKAFIPILTIMGQLYNIPLKYVYEGSNRLVEIGFFPLRFDWDIAEQYYPHLEDRLLKDAGYIRDNQEIIGKLQRDLLVTKNVATGVHQVTVLGKLLKDYVDAEMPHAQSVAGFIAEYKMFEYFCNFPYQKVYSTIKRSLKVKHPQVNNNQEEEIDLELRSSGQVVICEVKAFRRVYGNVSNIVKRAKARLEIYQQNGENVKEYILVIHIGSFDKIKNLSTNLEKIGNGIRQSQPTVVFRSFYIERPDKYQEFASRPLEEKELKNAL